MASARKVTFFKDIRWNRWGKKETLPTLHARLSQPAALCFGFNPLRNQMQVEIGAAVIGLVSARTPIHRDSIVDELVRLGRQKGDGVEDEVFLKAAELVRKGV